MDQTVLKVLASAVAEMQSSVVSDWCRDFENERWRDYCPEVTKAVEVHHQYIRLRSRSEERFVVVVGESIQSTQIGVEGLDSKSVVVAAGGSAVATACFVYVQDFQKLVD